VEVCDNINALNEDITDNQTRIRIFTHCTIQKLPHLLVTEIMHNLPEVFLEGNNNGWIWCGPQTQHIDATIGKFLASLLGRESTPNYVSIISQISIGLGGLGLLNSSHCAATDFVITMAAATRMANDSISFNPDLEQYHFCHSIMEPYFPCQNPGFDCLCHFH